MKLLRLGTNGFPEEIEVAVGGGQYVRKASDSSTNSTSLADVPGMAIAMEANQAYQVFVVGAYHGSTGTEAISISLNGPASPGSVIFAGYTGRSAAGNFGGQGVALAYNTAISGSNGSTSSESIFLTGVIVNGSTAGDLVMRYATENGGAESSTIEAGTTMILIPITVAT